MNSDAPSYHGYRGTPRLMEATEHLMGATADALGGVGHRTDLPLDLGREEREIWAAAFFANERR